MPRNEKRNETLVGAFLVFGLLMLGYLIVQFGQLGELFKKDYEVDIVFQEASGVIKGSTVRLGGTKIGQVSENPVLTDDFKARVTIAIDERIKLRKGSMFQISTASFLGDKVIVVTPPEDPGEGYIQPGAELAGGGPGGLELLQGEIETIAGDAGHLTKDARRAMAKLNDSLDDIRTLSTRLADSVETVNNDILSQKNIEHLNRSLANFEKATQGFSELDGELKPLLTDARGTLQDVRKAAKSADSAFQSADTEIARLKPTLEKLPEAVDSITRTSDQANETLAGFGKGEGALGALTNNTEVKEDTETFIKNLRKYGILRYRDAETSEKEDPRDRFRGRRR